MGDFVIREEQGGIHWGLLFSPILTALVRVSQSLGNVMLPRRKENGVPESNAIVCIPNSKENK